MTTEELHKILDDESVTLSLSELCDVIHRLKNDVYDMACKCALTPGDDSLYDYGFYIGEDNAFYIVLSLLEHLK